MELISLTDIIKNHVQRLFCGTCNVIEFQSDNDDINMTKPVKVYENIPCRLCFKSFPASEQSYAASVSQSVRLLLSPDLNIKPGSEIEVFQNGKLEVFICAGVSSVYISHQEINLKIKKQYA